MLYSGVGTVFEGIIVSGYVFTDKPAGAGSVLWQDEMNARGGGDVTIDIGAAGSHFQQDQLQLIEDQVSYYDVIYLSVHWVEAGSLQADALSRPSEWVVIM